MIASVPRSYITQIDLEGVGFRDDVFPFERCACLPKKAFVRCLIPLISNMRSEDIAIENDATSFHSGAVCKGLNVKCGLAGSVERYRNELGRRYYNGSFTNMSGSSFMIFGPKTVGRVRCSGP